tara:strand:- start:405 stop:509 length:105 start_codon:yes stop_codon:yes gene_type:complete
MTDAEQAVYGKWRSWVGIDDNILILTRLLKRRDR